MSAPIVVEVVYALHDRQWSRRVELAQGSTIEEAVAASGLMQEHPGIDLGRVGIFGERAGPSTCVRDGDRVELYRPLSIDPKELRRRRARRKNP